MGTKITKRQHESARGLGHASVYIGVGHCPPEVWHEAKVVALINKTTLGHVLGVALLEYLKRINGAAKRKGAK